MSLIKSVAEFTQPSGQIVRFTFTRGRPPVRATVAVAEAFRAAALSAFHATTGTKNSFLLTGHQPDGQPDKGHRHAYFLPQPDAEGTLTGILLASPHNRFSTEEMAAFQVVKALKWNGPSTKISLELADVDDPSSRQLATRWVSATPYVPLRRFWGTHGKRHLVPESQLRSEVEEISNCSARDLRLDQWGEIRVRVARRIANGMLSPPRRLAFTAEFQTEKPICGPIALGHSSHFGLGLFVPIMESGAGQLTKAYSEVPVPKQANL